MTSSQMGPRVGFSRVSLQHPDEKGWPSVILPYLLKPRSFSGSSVSPGKLFLKHENIT